ALQKNKVKYIVGSAVLVHSVDNLALAEALSARCLRDGVPPIGVLLQVNLAGEASKSGASRDEALSFARQMHALPGVALRGLMTVPPYSADPQEAAPWFSGLAGLAEEGRAEGLPLDELSMGMSGDLEVAVAHGATIVRIGTAIFGQRSYPKP
ncbi:MAG: pyridoxal phosphate enzyme (YggS family), partial [Myxococcota bacterium]